MGVCSAWENWLSKMSPKLMEFKLKKSEHCWLKYISLILQKKKKKKIFVNSSGKVDSMDL